MTRRYFVFGLVTGGSTLFYGLVWVCLSRRAPRPDPTRPDPTELAARANNNNNNYPTCGANNVDPQLFQQNLYAGSACAEKTDMPPISESPAGFSPMGPPQQQTSLAGYGQPLDEAPQFQPEGPNDALALENKVLTAVATVVPPVEYGSPSPLSPTAPTQDFEEEARL